MSAHFQSSHYAGSHFASSHFGGVELAVAVEYPPGGSSKGRRYGPSARQIQIQQQIEEENALMLAVVKAFLKMVE